MEVINKLLNIKLESTNYISNKSLYYPVHVKGKGKATNLNYVIPKMDNLINDIYKLVNEFTSYEK